MKLVAHRGFAREAPENTIAAFERAAALADAVEVDVRRCATGEPVVIHDETVDRVTDATGAVDDLALEELRALDVLGSGEGVATLAEVVAALPRELELFVELKEPGMAREVLEALTDHAGRTVVTSFSPTALSEVREVDPSVPRGLVAGDRRPDPVDRARALDCSALLLQWRLAFLPWVYRSARRSDLELYAWTVRSGVVRRALAALELDGLICDGRYGDARADRE